MNSLDILAEVIAEAAIDFTRRGNAAQTRHITTSMPE